MQCEMFNTAKRERMIAVLSPMIFLCFYILGQTIQDFTSPIRESFTNLEKSVTALGEVQKAYNYVQRSWAVVVRILYRVNPYRDS